jgi:hypothetical protein
MHLSEASRLRKKVLHLAKRMKKHTFGAQQAAEKLEISGEISEKRSSAAKTSIDSAPFMRGLKPPPPSGWSFSAAC